MAGHGSASGPAGASQPLPVSTLSYSHNSKSYHLFRELLDDIILSSFVQTKFYVWPWRAKTSTWYSLELAMAP